MHCPYCGHTSPYHDGDGEGCTQCTCHASWMDVVAINLSLRLG
jgi:hypothetical protein